MYFDRAFWIAAAERSLKTLFQTLAAALGTDAVGVLTVDLRAAVTLAVAAALLSLVTSAASAGVGPEGPALAGEETTHPRVRIVEVAVPAKKPATKPKAKTATAKPTAKKPATAKKATTKK
jgi:hypothetical protein